MKQVEKDYWKHYYKKYYGGEKGREKKRLEMRKYRAGLKKRRNDTNNININNVANNKIYS